MALFRRARSEREQIDRITELAVRVYADLGMAGEVVADPDDPLNTSIRTGSGIYGLANATLACLNAPEREWRALLERFAGSVGPNRPEPEPDLDHDASALRARLMPRDALVGEWMAYARPFAADLVEVLCLDLPTTVLTLSEQKLGGRDLDPLFAAGRANLAVEQIDSRELLDDGVTVLSGTSLFVASLALTPERLALALDGAPSGFVFALPDRHTVLAHAMVGEASVPAIQRLVHLAAVLPAEHRPGGLLSREVFFSHAGLLQQITTRDPETGALGIRAEGAFLDALNG